MSGNVQWRVTAARDRVSQRQYGDKRTRLPGAGLLSLAFLIIAGVWTKARGFLAR